MKWLALSKGMVVNQGMNQWLKANRRDCLRTWGDEVSACWVHRWVLSYSHDVERPSNMIGLHVRPTSTCAPPHTARELSQRAWLVTGESQDILRLFPVCAGEWEPWDCWWGWGPIMVHVFSEKIVCFWSGCCGWYVALKSQGGKAGFKVVFKF